jgi:hypothetical protein
VLINQSELDFAILQLFHFRLPCPVSLAHTILVYSKIKGLIGLIEHHYILLLLEAFVHYDLDLLRISFGFSSRDHKQHVIHETTNGTKEVIAT